MRCKKSVICGTAHLRGRLLSNVIEKYLPKRNSIKYEYIECIESLLSLTLRLLAKHQLKDYKKPKIKVNINYNNNNNSTMEILLLVVEKSSLLF